MDIKVVGLASDHAGYPLKEFVKTYLDAHNISWKDYGTDSEASCDYADFGHALARGIEEGEVYPGIAICGTGNGIAMTLNKHQGIRAALCWKPEICELARKHNDANVLVLPGRHLTNVEADAILEVFFTAEFEGGRHERRVQKIPV